MLMEKAITDILLGTVVVSGMAYLPFVISDACKVNRDKCDYLLILGGDVIGADTPSPQLFERMKAAVAYLNENPDTVAVPCGGCFRPEQKKSEAAIIAEYLVNQGIDEKRIVLEDESTITFQNFEYGARVIENHAKKPLNEVKIAFLSSTYHVHRSAIFAKMNGIENCGRVACKTPGRALPRYLRECVVALEIIYRKLPKKQFNND